MALLTFGIVDSRPLLVSPWEPLCLCVGVVFVESGEGCGVFDFGLGLGLVACGDEGGGCGGLEGSGGAGCEGAVCVVVEEEGDEGAERGEALLEKVRIWWCLGGRET